MGGVWSTPIGAAGSSTPTNRPIIPMSSCSRMWQWNTLGRPESEKPAKAQNDAHRLARKDHQRVLPSPLVR